ncbi:MAG TPA: discoidin domain-containing protein, partial [Chthoniobacteraceae bacterium]|nr:discoidin domain-containing protein [Chthoniobacteraceae bacterium]
KVLYPRIQEGCGEDADFAAAMLRAIVCGMQGGPEVNPQSMMITVKHWPSQGAGGEAGVVYDGTTIWYHMRPWHGAIEAGASAIMPGYSGSWLLNSEGRGAGDDPGIIGFLRNSMGYKGVICTDWLPSGAWIGACTAGSDVMGGANPEQMGNFEKEVPEARIDEAVRRVLDLKFRMGVFEDPYGQGVNGAAEWHTPQNVAIARKAAAESLTLLKNDGPLPIRLPAGSAIVVDGPRADDPRCMATWRSDFHETDFGSKTFFRAIALRAEKAGVTVYAPKARKEWREAPKNIKWSAPPEGEKIGAAIVVVGETYYTHGTFWDKNSPYLPDDPIGAPHDEKDGPQYAVIQQYHDQHIPVIVVCLLPRPYVLTNVNKLASSLLVVYRPGDEGGTAVAGLLWGDTVPQGKLSWQLPLSMDQVGTDDTAHWQDQPDKWDLPYDLGATPEERAEIRAAIAAGKHIEPIYGKPLYQAGSGLQGFGLTDSTPPAPFKTIAPADGANITGALGDFKWEQSSDPETGIQRYELYIDDKLADTERVTGEQLAAKELTVKRPAIAFANGKHTWYVKAYNWAGGTTASSASSFTMNDTTPPAAFQALLPANNATVAGDNPVTFQWEQSSDEGSGLAGYEVLLDGKTAVTVKPSQPIDADTNLALGKIATASSVEGSNPPGGAVDGDPGTRWSSAWKDIGNPDAAWLTIDLGSEYSIKEVKINWESPGKQYLIQVSDDNAHWTTIYTKTGEPARQEDLKGLSGAGRYVRMQGVARSGGYGYSIWEFAVFGSALEQAGVPVPSGKHAWQVRAIDGAGNATLNSNGPQAITR